MVLYLYKDDWLRPKHWPVIIMYKKIYTQLWWESNVKWKDYYVPTIYILNVIQLV
jgi:hypothetical protein